MSEEIRKNTYECPSTYTIDMRMDGGILQLSDPETGGGEGIGGGTDL